MLQSGQPLNYLLVTEGAVVLFVQTYLYPPLLLYLGNLNELFKDTIRLNTNFSGAES
jgi:hypothetical protein